MSNVSRLLVAVCGVAIIGSPLNAQEKQDNDKAPLKSLAEKVLLVGEDKKYIPAIADKFGIPLDDLTCREVAMPFVGEERGKGETRTCAVKRKQGSNEFFIVFMVAAKKYHVYFYLTSEQGAFENGVDAYKKIYLNPLVDSPAPDWFKKEVAYWREWDNKMDKAAMDEAIKKRDEKGKQEPSKAP